MEATTTTSTAAAWAAWLSTVILALVGVDYYALLGAFMGVLMTLSALEPMPRWRVAVTVAVTTFVAAAIGQGLSALMGPTPARSVLILLSVVSGAGGQVIVQACVAALAARIQKLGGQ